MPHLNDSISHAVMTVALATAQPSAGASAPPGDAARLVGAWTCNGTVPGSSSEHTYTRANDATFVLQALVHTSFGVSANVTETFSYDRARDTWTLGAGRNRFFENLQLTARPWTAREWSFDGRETIAGATRSVRIVYTFLAPDTFLRVHQTSADGRWFDDGRLTCRRVPAVAVRASAPPQSAHASPSPRSTLQQAAAVVPRGAASALPHASPSPRPTLQQAAAVVPRRVAQATPAISPTPLPIPGIIPAEAPTVQPSATRSPSAARSVAVRPTGSPLRLTPPAATSSPAAAPKQVPSTQPSATRLAVLRPQSPAGRSSRPPSAAAAPESDRAYRLTGSWACETLGGLPATHAYTRQGDGTIKLRNVLTIAKRDYGIDETYRFDRTKNVWTTTTGSDAYVGVAPKWVGDKWVFEGTMPDGNRRIPVQMVYSMLGDGAFRRDFVKVENGTSKTFAAETCHRP